MSTKLPLLAIRRSASAVAAILALSFLPQTQAATLYENFTLLDPVTKTATPDAWLVVDGERIVARGAGDAKAEAGWERRDMSGTFALPGFFDGHAHITAGPLTVDRSGPVPVVDMSSQAAVTRFHALTALAFGVTSIRNPSGDPQANHDYSRQVQAGELPGPEAISAGFAFDPVQIRGAIVYPASEAAWRAEVARQKALGMEYLKLYAGLSEAELGLAIRLAHENGMQAIGHLDQVSWVRAIELGIDALTHALPTSADLLPADKRDAYRKSRSPISSTYMYQWFELADFDGPEIKSLIALLAERQVEVDVTLMVHLLTYFFDDIDRVYPEADRAFVHPLVMKDWKRNMGASHYGWTPDDYRRAKAVFPKVLEFTRRLHEAGVPMLIGTDGYGGAPNYAMELQMHRQAGLSAWDVLALATHVSAERLGMGARTGRLQGGYEADIVFLNANPLDDMQRVREVHTTVVNGKPYSHQQLITLAREGLD
jgi:imidazolonepropionase-like amidohydrolase